MSKQAAYKLAEKLGAEIEDYGTSIELTAPFGQIFDDTHTRSLDTFDGRKGVWAYVIDDLRNLSTCENVDTCEFCQSNKEVGA